MSSIEELLHSDGAGVLRFGQARMALLDIEAGFWGLRRQLEALIGGRLTDFVLQQAGANGGASFANAFIGDAEVDVTAALRECVAAYEAAGFGRFHVEEIEWPLGRVTLQAGDTVEAWMMARREQQPERPVCAYSAGVLVGFINALTGRRDIVCVEHTCQACGDPACTFELLPAEEAGKTAVVGFDPDPFLSRQLNLLDILFDRMPMGIVIFDRNLHIRRFNPTWAEFMARYTPIDVDQIAPGVPLFELLPDTEAIFRPLLQRVLAGETIKEEALPSTSGGITSYWDVAFAPLHDGDQIIGVLDVVIDATKRQQMVADLRESEAHLLSMLESAQGYAIYRVVVDYEAPHLGRVAIVSPSIREVVGIETPYDFTSWFQSIHPDDAARVTAANRRAMEEGITFDEMMRFFHSGKEEWRWLHTVSNPVFNEEGQLTHFNGIVIDVTDQKRAEEMLTEHTAVLEQKVTERTQELATLLEVSQNVASTLELEPLLGVVLDQLRVVVGYDGASILELAGDMLHLLAYRGPIPSNEAHRLRFPLDGAGANRAVIERREPIIIPDVMADAPLANAFRETAGDSLETTFSYVRSWMGAPLIARGQVLGMISLDHGRPNFYTPELARLAQAFAGQVAVFIENGRLYTETRQRADEARAAYNVQQAIARRLDPDAVLQMIANEARRLTDTEMSAVYLLDGDELEITVVSGDVAAEMVGYRLPAAESIAGLVVEKGTPFLVPDAAREERVHRRLVDQVGANSFVIVPLMSEEEPIGTITVANKQGRPLGPDDERVLTLMASGAVIALENARLYESEHERRQVAESLRDILRVLNSNQPLSQVLDYVAGQARTLLGASSTMIRRVNWEKETVSTVASSRLPGDFEAIREIPLYRSGGEERLRNHETIAVSDLQAYVKQEVGPPVPAEQEMWMGLLLKYYRSQLVVPLFVRQNFYGTLTFYYDAPHAFPQEDMRLAAMLGDQASLAIENARLYRQEQERRQESERRRRVAEELRSIVQMLNSGRPLDEVLDYIVGQAVELMGGDTAVAIYRIDAAAGLSFLEAERGLPPALATCRELPLTLAGEELLRRREPLAVPDMGAWLPQPEESAPPHIHKVMQTTRDTYRSYLTVPLLIRDEVYGGMAFHYEQPRQFPAELVNLALTLGDQAALAIENARLYESEQERRQVAEGLRDILARLNSEQALPDLLDAVVGQADALLEGDVVALYLLDERERTLQIEALRGELAPVIRETVLPVGVGTVGRVAAERRPLVIPDVARLPIHDKWEKAYGEETAVFVDEDRGRQAALQEAMRRFRAVLAVPLLTQGAVYGGLAFYYHQPRAFSDEEIDLATTFADQAALAIQNARLRGRAEQAAVVQERNRLARELHDAVTQTLFSASLIADVLPRIWEKDSDQGKARLDELRELTRGALAEMRTLLLELRPATLTESSLGELLQQLSAAAVGRSRLPVEVVVEGERPLSPDVQIALYRIAQEALNNVVKHAGADQVAISLRFMEDEVELTVTDNGRGFDPTDVGAHSLGVGIMRERAEKIGADLTIDSQIGRGATIKVISPIVG